MAFRTLREKRLEYVESIRLDPNTNLPEGQTPTEQHPAHNSLLGGMFDKVAELVAGEPDDKPKYLVKLEEKDESHKPWYKRMGAVTWLEKATQRDFALGSSIGGLVGLGMVATGGVGIAAVGAVALAGGVIGGVSDYINNTNEMENGAVIEPPSHFNRDTVKYALGWAGAAKLALLAGTIAVNAVVPGAAAAVVIPEIVGTVAMAAGAVYGAFKGSRDGYERMEQDYACAIMKHQRPELKVTQIRSIVRDLDELGMSTLLAVGAGAVPMMSVASTSASSPTVTSSTPAAVGTLSAHTKQLPMELAQAGQSSPFPSAIGSAELQDYAKHADQRATRATLENIPLEAPPQKTWAERNPSKAGQALVLPQAREGGYTEFVASQPRDGMALQAS